MNQTVIEGENSMHLSWQVSDPTAISSFSIAYNGDYASPTVPASCSEGDFFESIGLSTSKLYDNLTEGHFFGVRICAFDSNGNQIDSITLEAYPFLPVDDF